ncbi:MAG: hypothetical protein ABR888_08460 [Thermoplasmata archaeon]|jgi:ABC-type transport system involved in multi-copper enzyme maturation permease subunit
MKAYLHDLRHVLSGRVAVLALIIAVAGSAFAYGAVAGQSGTTYVNGSGFDYYEGGAYHIDLWVFGISGEPLGGVSVELSIGPWFNASGGSSWFNVSQVSDSSGQLQFVVPVQNGSYSVQTYVSYGGVSTTALQLGGALQGFELAPAPGGEIGGLDPVTPVSANYYDPVAKLVAIWAGANGSLPHGAQLVYCSSASADSGNPPQNCSGFPTYPLGVLGGFRTIFPQPQVANATWVIVELTDPQQGVVDSVSYTGQNTNGEPIQPGATLVVSPPGEFLLNSFLLEEAPLIALAAIAIAYVSYAQARLSGTLEPVLVRRVTRRGILLSRYVGTTVLVAGTVVLDVLFLDFAAETVLGQPLPSAFLIPLIGSLLADGLAFAGIIYLFSHVFQTTRAVVAAGGAVGVTFGVLWGTLSSLFGGSGTAYGSSSVGFATTQLRLWAISPGQLPYLSSGFLSQWGTIGYGGSQFALAGISTGLLATVAVLWIGLPLLGALWLATVRD